MWETNMNEPFVIEIDSLKMETDRAYLVKIDGDEYWLPKSHADLDDLTLTLPHWLAKEKGFDEL